MPSKMIVLLASLLALLCAGGCASRALTSANADHVTLRLEPSDFDVIASVQGKSCTARVFGMTFNNPDLLVAEVKAMSRASGSNLLVNKHAYFQEETVVPLVFGNECFYVEGVGIKVH